MAKWTGKTRGSLLGYQFVIWFIKIFGLSSTYPVLNIIAGYYARFSEKSQQHLRDFYTNKLGFSSADTKNLIKKNFQLLAQSLTDKVAISMGYGSQISFTHEGDHYLRELSESKQGAFLISAHLSNWDIAGQTLDGVKTKVNVVMYENEHESIKKYLDKQRNAGQFNVIAQKNDLSHLIKIYQAIKRGEFVCMHADRFVDQAPTFGVDFLGSEAHFPAGPFQLIEKLKVPYTFVFTAKTSKLSYHFSATKPEIPAGNARDIAVDFVKLLEEKVKEHPAQWFNYHDFYRKP